MALDRGCDTSAIGHFALVERFDLLVSVLHSPVLVPRVVLDPKEDPDGVQSLLSEIGKSERYWARRSADPEAMDNWSRLRALRKRQGIQILDMSGEEEVVYSELITPEYAREVQLAAPLGAGEAAVIAIAEGRDWGAVLDEEAARRVLGDRSPDTPVRTSRDLLRRAVVTFELLNTEEAQVVYADMLAKGYRGPPRLWG